MTVTELKSLAKQVEKADKEANEVNIGSLPNDDIHKIIAYNRSVRELINYIAGL